jgi:hypothetical protein
MPAQSVRRIQGRRTPADGNGAALALFLTLPLLVLVRVVDSHPEAMVVLSVGLAVHAALCLLLEFPLHAGGTDGLDSLTKRGNLRRRAEL